MILLVRLWPLLRFYMTSERDGGYLRSSPKTDWLFNIRVARVVYGVWFLTAFGLTFGKFTLLASFLNFLFCFTYFIRTRWISVARGMGAPGFMPYWIGTLVFLLEYAFYFGDRGGYLRWLILLTFQIDYGIMMMDSGFNKIMHRYPQNDGMNYGMANPAWGYWPDFFRKLPPQHWFFKFTNHSAYSFQILGGLCMLIPPVQWVGAFIIAFGFWIVSTQIRLGVLCHHLMLITMIFTKPGGWVDRWLADLVPIMTSSSVGVYQAPDLINTALAVALWTYIVLLPLCKLGMYANFYGKITFPKLLQRALERYTSFFGIILWRVFTYELIDFFIRVYFEDKTTKQRTLHTRFGHWSFKKSNRFLWVGESITSLIVFNTIRYFGDEKLFKERVLRYAKTMPRPKNADIILEYVQIVPSETEYRFVPAREFRADIEKAEVTETVIDPSVSIQFKKPGSPLHVSGRPGSYAPK